MSSMPRLWSSRWAWSLFGAVLALALVAGRVFAEPRTAADELKDSDERAAITFAGFHVFEDGTSRIWVKLDRQVAVDREGPSKKRLVYVLKQSRVLLKNNKNPLITQYFPSPVSQARLVTSKDDTQLVIELRENTTPNHRVVTRGDGTVSFQVDFPAPGAPGTAPPKSQSE
jgi:hypothetical protein